MKLNYRDKIILTIAIVALVWVAGIMLFIKPGIEDYKTAQATLDDAKAKLATLQQRIKEDENLDDRIVVAYKEADEMTNSFYIYQQTQEATQKIDDLLKVDGIVNVDMGISAYESYPLHKYVYTDETVVTDLDNTVFDYENTKEGMYIPDDLASDGQAQQVETVPVQGVSSLPNLTNIGRYSIEFEFKGKLGDLKEFCRKLEEVNKEKTILIERLEFNYPEEIKEEEEKKEEAKSGDDDEDEKPKASSSSDKDKDKEEEDPNEKDIQGKIKVNMIVVRKLPDPSKF